nr:hypothetical protein Itr_chr07CG18720 [Ipomoea trifida]
MGLFESWMTEKLSGESAELWLANSRKGESDQLGRQWGECQGFLNLMREKEGRECLRVWGSNVGTWKVDFDDVGDGKEDVSYNKLYSFFSFLT